jgi:ATP adenylyltransferase
LNAFPYTSGHVLIAPDEQVATPELAREETLIEMMLLTRQAVVCLRKVCRPDSVNLRMNIGEFAGALDHRLDSATPCGASRKGVTVCR